MAFNSMPTRNVLPLALLGLMVAAGGYFAFRDHDSSATEPLPVQLAQAPSPRGSEVPRSSFAPQGMPQLPPGTAFVASEFAKQPPQDWNRLILFVEGRLGSGDVDAATSTIQKYTKLFNLVILAHVGQHARGHYLDRVGVGFSTKINGRDTVITLETEAELGANLGLIGRSVFGPNEKALNDIVQVARTPQAVMFDAPTMMLYKDEHRLMVVRYLIWVHPASGETRTLVWLVDPPNSNNGGQDKPYVLADVTFQSLKPNLVEDRVMNVKGDRINFLGIPAADAFALVRIPQGTAIPITDEMAQFATIRKFDEPSFAKLLTAIEQAMAQKR